MFSAALVDPYCGSYVLGQIGYIIDLDLFSSINNYIHQFYYLICPINQWLFSSYWLVTRLNSSRSSRSGSNTCNVLLD